MRRMTIICLLALTSTVMEAQEQTKNTVLVDGPIFMVAFSELEEDKKAKEKTVVWPSTENAWIKDFVWAKDVHAIGRAGLADGLRRAASPGYDPGGRGRGCIGGNRHHRHGNRRAVPC